MACSGDAVVTYLEGGHFVGQREHYACSVNIGGESHSAYWPHLAYFCPLCGELWGRALYSYSFDYQPLVDQPWVIEQRRCVKHGDGQFLAGVDAHFLDQCSPELLTREMLALMENS